MYRVRWEHDDNSLVDKDASGVFSLQYAKGNGKVVEFATKREAERALKARAKLTRIPEQDYEIVKIGDDKMTSKIATEELVDKLLTAVTAEYKDDKPTAGIVFSKLPDGQVYGSVVRYNLPGNFGATPKTVIAKTTNKSVRGAIIDLSQTWLGKTVAKDDLAKALKGA